MLGRFMDAGRNAAWRIGCAVTAGAVGAALVAAPAAASTAPPQVTTIGGSVVPGPTAARAIDATGTAAIAAGGGVVYETNGSVIRAIDEATGTQRVVVGDGTDLGFPASGPGTQGGSREIFDLAAGSDGTLFFDVESPSFQVRKYDPVTGIESLVPTSLFLDPIAVTADDQVLYTSNTCQVSALDPATGTSHVVAGTTCGVAQLGQSALTATFGRIDSVGVLPNGDLLILEANFRVWDVPSAGPISELAEGDGGYVADVAASASGTVYIVEDISGQGVMVRQVGAGGALTTVAGGGTTAPADGVPATSAQLGLSLTGHSGDFAVGAQRPYFADQEFHGATFRPVRFVQGDGTLGTLISAPGVFGDGGPALAAQLFPQVIAAHSGGVVDVLQATADAVEVRRIAAGQVSAAGQLPSDQYTDAVDDRAGGLYAATSTRILHLDAGGRITTVVAKPNLGAIAADAVGNVYYDTFDQLGQTSSITRHNVSSGRETTIYNFELVSPSLNLPGPGSANMLTVTPKGTVYFASQCAIFEVPVPQVAIPVINATNQASCARSGDGGPAVQATGLVTGIGTDDLGDLFIMDSFDDVVRRIDRHGTINTVAGTGTPGFAGDGVGPSTPLDSPHDITVSPDGTAYFVEQYRVRAVTGAASTSSAW